MYGAFTSNVDMRSGDPTALGELEAVVLAAADAGVAAENAARSTAAGVISVERQLIGDAAAPGPIAWATYAGRRFAEELDTPDDRGDTPRFRREVAGLEPGPSRLP